MRHIFKVQSCAYTKYTRLNNKNTRYKLEVTPNLGYNFDIILKNSTQLSNFLYKKSKDNDLEVYVSLNINHISDMSNNIKLSTKNEYIRFSYDNPELFI